LENDENLDEKRTKMRPIAEISSNQNDGATDGIYVTIYSAKNLMETALKKEGKIGGKNPGKYMYKLTKQQRERCTGRR